jgi:hypothetical protein
MILGFNFQAKKAAKTTKDLDSKKKKYSILKLECISGGN